MNAKTRTKPRMLVIVVLCAALSSSADAQTKLLTWLREQTWQRHRERMAAGSSMQKSKPCS